MEYAQNNEEKLAPIRHTLAHLLAASVRELYPGAKNAIGPVIENGFYQDFDLPAPISEEDFPKIEETMRKKLKEWTSSSHREVSIEEAKKEFAWNEYKTELIDEFATGGKTLTFYTLGDFLDLCKGGHCENPAKEVDPEAFKLSHVAGAYWRGDEKNKMLTRIYGFAFENKTQLEEHETRLEEARRRDHRKLGRDLGLFVFSETVGRGLPLWTHKGATIRRELERFIVDEELRRGYLHVYTPDIANLALYRKSGHYPYYKDSMYAPVTIDEDEYMLRPMTCPHHFEIYLSEKHSYRELPLRYAELAHLYRYEQSGELSGLIRVRTFTLADAHIVARRDQAQDEIESVLDLVDYVCGVLGLEQGTDYRYRLSLGDRADESKYFKDDASWDVAEDVLRQVLVKRKANFYEAEQEAAFYGPKIDIQMKNVNGKEDTAFTVQYDFVMPKRFGLAYVNSAGEQEEPMVVHRSSVGAIERVVAFLIERYAGAFPLWLAPTQVIILPVSEKFEDYAREVAATLRKEDFRVEIADGSETLGKRIAESQAQKIPYIIVVGEKEMTNKTVNVRHRSGQSLGEIDPASFVATLREERMRRVIK
jgi:threonyl-tRNA synthetase